MAFDRDIVVECVQRHYDLLVRAAYLEPSIIQTPPSEGWSDDQIMADVLRELGRSEAVIDLLRHLPYLKSNHTINRCEVYEVTEPMNYLRELSPLRKETVDSCRGRTEAILNNLMPAHANWPSSFIPLTWGREATYWIIDTDEGVIWPVGLYAVDTEAPDEEPWRQLAHRRDIQEYFDEVYEEILSLKQVPIPKGKRSWYSTVVPGEDPQGLVMRRLLWEHGWPDALDKEAYLAALAVEHPDTVPLELA